MNVISALQFDRPADLDSMLALYLNDNSRDIACDMRELFSIAREVPKAFLHSTPVLGISIGGSNTKMMLTSAEPDHITVHHFTSTKNPKTTTHLYDFLDSLLLSQPDIVEYLKTATPCYIGFSIPTPIVNEIPIHASKLATIDGLLARSEADFCPELNFTNNICNYFASRGFNKPVLYYNMDGIVAHFGGVSLLDIKPSERSILFVGGTGLALADDNIDRFLGMYSMLPETNPLYPADATEQGQYQYAVVGKGIFGIMQRAVALHAKEENSPLANVDLSGYFSEIPHSKTVFKLYEYAKTGKCQDKQVDALKSLLSTEGFNLVLEFASLIVTRAIGSIANCIIASLIKLNRDDPHSVYHLVLEGSVAQNPLVKQQVAEILQSEHTVSTFEKYGVPTEIRLNGTESVSVLAANDTVDLSDIDYTIIGACTSVIAKTYLDSQK